MYQINHHSLPNPPLFFFNSYKQKQKTKKKLHTEMGGIRHLEMPKERDGSLSQKIENKRSARFGLSTDRQVIISSGRGAR